jgi:hypothetical protein
MMKTDTDGKLPLDVLSRFQVKMAALEMKLAEEDPNIATYLKDVHALVSSYPETVWLLEDREMAAVVKAAQIHASKVIVAEKVKASATGRGKSLKNASKDDF